MNNPGGWSCALFDCLPPLDETALFADMYFLAAAYQPDDDTPPGNSFREFHEVLRFRPSSREAWRVSVSLPHLVGVEPSLRFIKYENVLRRNEVLARGVPFHIVDDITYEYLAAASGVSQLILKYLNKRPVTGEKDGGSGRFAVLSWDRQIVEEVGMDDSQTNKCLPGSGYSGKQNQSSRLRASGFVDNPGDFDHSRVCKRSGALYGS